jgi:hypothetical protein
VVLLTGASCSISGSKAREEDLVDVYVLAIRARERGEREILIQQQVDGLLQQRGVSREDLRRLVAELDGNPDRWARLWSRIDERLRSSPQE